MDLGIPGLEDAEEIGRGGFATVYRARQAAYHREVAVKVLSAQVDDTTLARFQREVEAMGSLSEHPGIVALHSAGRTAQGRPYIVMPHMSGGTLQDVLDRGDQFSPQETAETINRLASALEAAHQQGVLHRDVKPANVLLGRFGDPMLADFGIARVAGGHETTSGVITASIAHAAPEILDGRPPTTASDQYCLASTMYAMAAGKPAFTSDTDDSMVPLISRTMLQPPPEIDGLGDAAMQVLRRAMAKDPAQRYPSATAFAEAFADAVAGREPAPVDPPSWASGATAHVPGPPATPPLQEGGDVGADAAAADATVADHPRWVVGGVAAVLLLAVVAAAILLRGGGSDAGDVTASASDTPSAVASVPVEPTAVTTPTGDQAEGAPDDDAGDAAQDEAEDLGLAVAEADSLPPVIADTPPREDPLLNGGLPEEVLQQLDTPTRRQPIASGQVVDLELGPHESVGLTFEAPPHSLARVFTTGDAVDPAIALYEGESLLLRADDDTGGGDTGVNALLDVPLPRDGLHTVGVVNLDDGPGVVSVGLYLDDPDPFGPVPGEVRDDISTSFEPGVFTFAVEAGMPPPSGIRAVSPDFDATLRIIDQRGRVLVMATGGAGADVDTSDLGLGTYYVLVAGDDDGATGDYTVQLR